MNISSFSKICKLGSTTRRDGVEWWNKILMRNFRHAVCYVGFLGDAFLALWKIKRDNLDFSIRRIIKCATRIQERCDNWHTDVGVKLRVKIGKNKLFHKFFK